MTDVRHVWSTVVVVGLLAACGSHPCPDPDSPGSITFAGGAELRVRIADDPEERANGLMGVTTLPADEGMVFTFGDTPQDAEFWMRDTPVPLSIAFVDADQRIVTIREMNPCAEDPCRTYGSDAPYVMAIEANAGWFGKHGIEQGERIGSFYGPFCE
jgi:uncharacterized membrane protein (UPF0127 family)